MEMTLNRSNSLELRTDYHKRSNTVSANFFKIQPDTEANTHLELTDESFEREQLKNLTEEEIQNANLEQVVLWLSEYGGGSQVHQDVAQRRKSAVNYSVTYNLIERLVQFPEMKDLNTKGRTMEELQDLIEIFRPLNKGGFNLLQDVYNKHKLYAAVMVKVNDIKNLETITSQLLHLDDEVPRPDLFDQRWLNGTKIEVDYFVSLIGVPLMWLNHVLLWEDNATTLFKIDGSSAMTVYVRGHAQLLFDSLRNVRIFQFFQAIVWVIMMSFHILTQDDDYLNSICIPLLFAWNIIHIILSMFTRLTLRLFLTCITNPGDRSRYENFKATLVYLKSWFFDFWHACDWILQYGMLIYLLQYPLDEEYHKQGLLAISNFCAYLKLISFFRFFKEPGKLVSIILYVAHKSLNFVLIIVIIIIADAFSSLALRYHTDFSSSLQFSYGLTFGEYVDDFSTFSQWIGFIIATYTIPLLLLNLLISIMQDIHTQVQDNWEVFEIREKYKWSVEAAFTYFILLKLTCRMKNLDKQEWKEQFLNHKHIHYVVPKALKDDQQNDADEWQGHVRRVRQSISRGNKEVIDAVREIIHEADGNVVRQRRVSGTEGKIGGFSTESDRKLDALTQNIDRISESIETQRQTIEAGQFKSAKRMQCFEGQVNAIERKVESIEGNLNKRMSVLEGKMNQMLEILKNSRSN